MKKAGYTKAIGKYLESDRNEQVKDFYDKLGFNCLKEEQNDKLEKEYYYSLKNMNIVLSENYKLNENE